jgi:hypothetical protein
MIEQLEAASESQKKEKDTAAVGLWVGKAAGKAFLLQSAFAHWRLSPTFHKQSPAAIGLASSYFLR